MENDQYSRLWCTATSNSSADLVNYIHKGISSRNSKQRVKAIAALLADLLNAECNESGSYCFRGMASSDFSRRRVGYKLFRFIIKGMITLGLIEFLHHSYCLKTRSGKCPRFRGTAALFKLTEDFGIQPRSWSSHFSVAPKAYAQEPPIVLKARNEKHWHFGMDQPEKIYGRRIAVDLTRSPALEAAKQVQEINDFVETQTIDGAPHAFFQRVFADGDDGGEGAAFRRGARLYSVDGYQSMPSGKRELIRINGDETVELDISASYLTIYYALRSTALPPGDPYAGLGFPREVAKAWVLMTFGCKSFPTKWSTNLINKMREKTGIDLTKYRVRDVSKAVRNRLALFKDWPKWTDIDWGVLQFRESNAIINCVHNLAKDHRVLALPVFDSIIVAKSHEMLAQQVLIEAFEREIGAIPEIKAKK